MSDDEEEDDEQFLVEEAPPPPLSVPESDRVGASHVSLNIGRLFVWILISLFFISRSQEPARELDSEEEHGTPSDVSASPFKAQRATFTSEIECFCFCLPRGPCEKNP